MTHIKEQQPERIILIQGMSVRADDAATMMAGLALFNMYSRHAMTADVQKGGE